MVLPILAQIGIGLALFAIAYLIMPKPVIPKQEQPEFESPTVDAGKPIPVLFGTMTIKDPNIIFSGEKNTRKYKVK